MAEIIGLGELLINFVRTAAGLSTTKSGGISSVPTLEEVQSYL